MFLHAKKETIILALILPVIMASPWQIGPEETKPPDYFALGEASYQVSDMVSFLENAKQAVKLAPGNPKYLYTLARAHALRGNPDKAIRCLEKAVEMGFFFTSRSDKSQKKEDSDFSFLTGSDDYRTLLTRILELNHPLRNSEIAFEIDEKGIMPEGIAHDPVEQAFYVGSLNKRKILKIDKSAHIAEFAGETQDGLYGVTGMEVDAKRRVLWVNSSALRIMKGYKENELGSAGVFKYDLDSGKLIRKYLLRNRPLHLFNSLAVSSRGDVYITDSLLGVVYLISENTGSLELFLRPMRFSYPTGIAISDDDQFLYVSHVEGTSVIDIQSKTCSLLAHPDDLSLALIDGLSYYQGSLLTVQGAHRPERVVQFFLGRTLDSVRNSRILEANNPAFDFPTSGVVVGNEFYYIANSQSQRNCSDEKNAQRDKPQIALIMKVELEFH